MLNKKNNPKPAEYSALPGTYVINNKKESSSLPQLTGSVTGVMSLPVRTRSDDGLQLGVALESYRSLAEVRHKAKG